MTLRIGAGLPGAASLAALSLFLMSLTQSCPCLGLGRPSPCPHVAWPVSPCLWAWACPLRSKGHPVQQGMRTRRGCECWPPRVSGQPLEEWAASGSFPSGFAIMTGPPNRSGALVRSMTCWVSSCLNTPEPTPELGPVCGVGEGRDGGGGVDWTVVAPKLHSPPRTGALASSGPACSRPQGERMAPLWTSCPLLWPPEGLAGPQPISAGSPVVSSLGLFMTRPGPSAEASACPVGLWREQWASAEASPGWGCQTIRDLSARVEVTGREANIAECPAPPRPSRGPACSLCPQHWGHCPACDGQTRPGCDLKAQNHCGKKPVPGEGSVPPQPFSRKPEGPRPHLWVVDDCPGALTAPSGSVRMPVSRAGPLWEHLQVRAPARASASRLGIF